MGNTRLAYTNLIDSSTLQNAPSADASFPATNAKNGERYIPTKTAAGPPSPVEYEWDLGSAQAVTVAAVLNMSSLITSIDVESSSTGLGGSWTTRATITPAGRVDKGAAFASQTFRYWRFRVFNTGVFTIGRLWSGVIQSDMATVFSPGTIKRTIKNRRREFGPAGVQHSFYNGRALHEWQFRFSKILEADRILLDNVIQQQKSILLIDDLDEHYEVEGDDSLDWSVIWKSSGVDDVERLVFQELL